MKKIIISCLCIMLLTSLMTTISVEAAEMKLISVAVPITTGLQGSSNAAKDFIWNFLVEYLVHQLRQVLLNIVDLTKKPTFLLRMGKLRLH